MKDCYTALIILGVGITTLAISQMIMTVRVNDIEKDVNQIQQVLCVMGVEK